MLHQENFIATILQYPDWYYDVADKIKQEYFTDDFCFTMTGVFNEITSKGIDLSLASISKYEYKTSDLIEYSKQSTTNSRKDIHIILDLIIDEYKVSKIKSIADKINETDISMFDTPIDELLTNVNNEIDLLKNIATKNNLKTIKSCRDNYLNDIEDIYNGKEDIRMLKTNYRTINHFIGGFKKAELIILAGRPAMGKTTLAMNLAEDYSSKYNTVFFSLEMAKEELLDRLVAKNGDIDLGAVRTDLNNNKMNSIISTYDKIENSKLIIDDNAGNSIDDIIFISKRLKKQNKLDIVFIDNINIIKSTKRYSSPVERMTDISGRLKVLARDLDVPVVVLSQLSRGVESRDDKRPLMSDLRESGSIEQDADIVMLLYRGEYYYEKQRSENDTIKKEISVKLENSRNKAELIIGKCRRAKTGTCDLMFDGSRSNFYERY